MGGFSLVFLLGWLPLTWLLAFALWKGDKTGKGETHKSNVALFVCVLLLWMVFLLLLFSPSPDGYTMQLTRVKLLPRSALSRK